MQGIDENDAKSMLTKYPYIPITIKAFLCMQDRCLHDPGGDIGVGIEVYDRIGAYFFSLLELSSGRKTLFMVRKFSV